MFDKERFGPSYPKDAKTITEANQRQPMRVLEAEYPEIILIRRYLFKISLRRADLRRKGQ
jgi:hypothetical protein